MWPTQSAPPPAKDGGFEECTTEQFDRALLNVVDTEDPVDLLKIPGIHEILAEELNNQVLEEWAWSQHRCADCGQRMVDNAYCPWCEPEEEE